MSTSATVLVAFIGWTLFLLAWMEAVRSWRVATGRTTAAALGLATN